MLRECGGRRAQKEMNLIDRLMETAKEEEVYADAPFWETAMLQQMPQTLLVEGTSGDSFHPTTLLLFKAKWDDSQKKGLWYQL